MESLSATKKMPSAIADESGIKITSPNFGVTLNLIHAGSRTDPDTGRVYKWDESAKITIPTVGDKVGSIKLSALQLAFVRDALTVPEIKAELDKRIAAEKAALLAQLGGL